MQKVQCCDTVAIVVAWEHHPLPWDVRSGFILTGVRAGGSMRSNALLKRGLGALIADCPFVSHIQTKSKVAPPDILMLKRGL